MKKTLFILVFLLLFIACTTEPPESSHVFDAPRSGLGGNPRSVWELGVEETGLTGDEK